MSDLFASSEAASFDASPLDSTAFDPTTFDPAAFDALETELSFADVDPGEGQRWSTWPAITPPNAAPSRGPHGS